MDLVALSEATAALVAAGAAQNVGEQAVTGMMDRIRNVFRGDARATESLEEAVATGDETSVQELAEALRWHARRDEEFAADLERWAAVHTQVAQNVQAGRDAYTAGRDQSVTVHHHYGQRPWAKTVRLRVLVSWTSDDLQDHREQVRRALRRLGVEEVESNPGARPLADHLNEVRGCDLFLGVFAWRYGPVPEGSSCSLPELELRAAQEAGVPCLLFLLSDRVPWPPGAMDRGEAGQRIDGLREELAAGPDCEHFTNAADLGARVEELVGPRTLGGETTSHTGSEMAVH